MKCDHRLERLKLKGVRLAPPQTWGGITLFPVLRDDSPGDLRLAKQPYEGDLALVNLGGKPNAEKMEAYISYIPHGLIMEWREGRQAVAAWGTQLSQGKPKVHSKPWITVDLMHRMVKRESKNRLRLLPLHLAMEGFLSLHFGGPNMAWREYSRRVMRSGLSPRWEVAVPGSWVVGLADALRTFEFHANQVGVLLFVANSLMAAFVVSHPQDYRALHQSLLEDFYGTLIYHYGMYSPVALETPPLQASQIDSLADLEHAVAAMRHQWAAFTEEVMSGDLIGRSVLSQTQYHAGPFCLQRFMTDLDPTFDANFIGESMIRPEDGTVEYLKVFRLSATQTRRAYLLKQLASCQWHLETAARTLGHTPKQLVRRIDNAGLGYLFKRDVLAQARWS